MALARPLAAAFAAVILCASLAAQSQVIQPAKAERTTETRTLPLASGSTLKVKNVNGFVRVKLYKGNVIVVGARTRDPSAR